MKQRWSGVIAMRLRSTEMVDGKEHFMKLKWKIKLIKLQFVFSIQNVL